MKNLFFPFYILTAMCLCGCRMKLSSNHTVVDHYKVSKTVHESIFLSGTMRTETREAADFTGISAATGIKVSLAQAASWKVEVSADENVLHYVSTEVIDGILNIGYTEDISIHGRPATSVEVWCPEVRSLSASSGAKILLRGTIAGDALRADASSAGRIEGELEYDEVTVFASSGGRTTFSGECVSYRASASSGASAIAAKLVSDTACMNASSGAKATVFVKDCLKAEASSGGKIIYYGNPARCSENSSIGGKIKRGR